jgi:hypothetical protein
MEKKLHWRTLMRKGEWVVPEEQRPEVPPAPRETTKTEQMIDRFFYPEGGLAAVGGEQDSKLAARLAQERLRKEKARKKAYEAGLPFASPRLHIHADALRRTGTHYP